MMLGYRLAESQWRGRTWGVVLRVEQLATLFILGDRLVESGQPSLGR
jgi:hypothetical protein